MLAGSSPQWQGLQDPSSADPGRASESGVIVQAPCLPGTLLTAPLRLRGHNGQHSLHSHPATRTVRPRHLLEAKSLWCTWVEPLSTPRMSPWCHSWGQPGPADSAQGGWWPDVTFPDGPAGQARLLQALETRGGPHTLILHGLLPPPPSGWGLPEARECQSSLKIPGSWLLLLEHGENPPSPARARDFKRGGPVRVATAALLSKAFVQAGPPTPVSPLPSRVGPAWGGL